MDFDASAPDRTLLEGLISVQAALETGSRLLEVVYIRDDKRDADALKIARLAAAAGVSVERVPADFIDQQAGGTTHGGILARAGARRFVALESLVERAACPFVVMLDGVEDPFNFGQAVRAFYAAGADGLIVRPRNWLAAGGIVARASAGASERLPMAVAESAEQAAEILRACGLRIAIAAESRSISLYEADLSAPLFLLVGGEKRGVTRSFAERADLRLKIPYGRAFDQSLGTAAAAAIFAFEIMRQRGLRAT